MEKKQSKWIWKTVVAACIAASILSYMCIPSVKNMMNKIVVMFVTGLMILFALSLPPETLGWSGNLWLPTETMLLRYPSD